MGIHPCCFCSVVSDSAAPWTAARQASLSFTNSQSLLKLMSIELVMLSNPSHPLPPSFPFAVNLSQHQGFSPMSWLFVSGGQSIEALASACLSNEYLGLVSFRIDWFDLLAVQRTLKSLLQQHNEKASTLQCSAFFIVQLPFSSMIS